jgi:hypothetical protein
MRWDESSSRFRLLFAHDLFGKPLRTFPDRALDSCLTRFLSANREPLRPKTRLAECAESPAVLLRLAIFTEG